MAVVSILVQNSTLDQSWARAFLGLRACAFRAPGGTLSRWHFLALFWALNIALLRSRSYFFRARPFSLLVSFRATGFLSPTCVYTYIYIHSESHTHPTHIYIHPNIDTYIIYIHIHTYCTYIHTYMHTPLHTCTHSYIEDSQNGIFGTGQEEQDGQNRTARARLSGQDCHDGTARTGLPGQDCRDRTASRGLPVQDCSDRTAGTRLQGQDYQERTARIGQLGQDSPDSTAGTGLPVQGCQDRTLSTGLTRQDCRDRTTGTELPGLWNQASSAAHGKDKKSDNSSFFLSRSAFSLFFALPRFFSSASAKARKKRGCLALH
jgi:hypothetical protein